MVHLQACWISWKSFKFDGVVCVVAEMATIRKTPLISLKSRFCEDAIIIKNLPKLLVELSNIAVKTGC
jgi:hypothetical protein